MEIPLKNRILNIELNIFWQPNLQKLTNELQLFFDKNEIEGMQIKKFRLDKWEHAIYEIIPEEPYFESILSGGDYHDKIKEIGRKYGVRNLDFVSYCYHK